MHMSNGFMTKKVYELTYYEDHQPMVVESAQRGQFDITRLWRGKPLGSPIPRTVRLYVNAGKAGMTDYVPNTLSWPVCSQRFIDLLSPLAESDFELFDAPLFDVTTKDHVAGFKIMNVVRLIECLDIGRSVMAKRFPCAIVPVFKARKLPNTVHIFRAAESPCGVLLSEEAVQQLRGKGLRGVGFITHKTS
jgi:hypothetical protein